ncbi:MAG: twitching motility protein PilT [Bacteroidetes bacterium GWF2_40_14]|jgi:predicted nucleic acid-binding protein|nr:MAG: twitching motility protein PilT [Bacteroidetes bacterium GWF2_40_14]
MKKIFIDTNIIIDLLAKREPFYDEAAILFTLADKQKIELSVSALTFANTNYILLQSKKPDDAKLILRKLKLIVQVLSLDEKIVGLSLNDNEFKDYEDALQYFTALENGVDAIITRNLKDFQKAKLPVMTAAQFLKTIK